MEKKFLKFYVRFTIPLLSAFLVIVFSGYSVMTFFYLNSIKTLAESKRKILTSFLDNGLENVIFKEILSLEKIEVFENVDLFYKRISEQNFFSVNENIKIDFATSSVFITGKTAGNRYFLAKFSFLERKNDFDRRIFYYIIISFLIFIGVAFYSYSFFKKFENKLIRLAGEIKSGKTGSVINLENEFYPFFKEFQDLTILENKEKLDLNTTLSIFKNILNRVDEAVFVIDVNENIVFANERFKEIFYPYSENKKYWEVILENSFIGFVEDRISTFCRIQFRDRIFELEKFFYNSFVAVKIKDVSELERLEEKKREFISYVSHEVRTPLTVIKGYLELIDSEKDIKRIKEFTGTVLKNIDRIIKLLSELLRLSILEESKIELEKSSFDLNDVFKEIASFYEPKLMEKRIRVNLESYGNSVILADRDKIVELFSNLFDNSVKFTEDGVISIIIKNRDGFVEVEFSDSGVGIDEKDLPYIFDKFYTAKHREKKGFGLGLSIAKRIVLLHNGSIKVESKKNSGTKFTVILPEK
jgi:signal transduction histidine kinase